MSYVRQGQVKGRFKWSRAAMFALANAATMAITVRSFDRGRGVDEQPHRPPYTKAYKARKKASGRNVKKIDLSWSGRLRMSIRPTHVSKYTAVIAMTGHPKIYGTFVNQLRPFMSSSKSVRKTVRATFRGLAKGRTFGGAVSSSSFL